MAPVADRALSAGLLLTLSAPSGAGKTSLVQALLRADANLVVSVSHTTRPRRSKEVDGVNYHFVDRQRFAAMAQTGSFLEHAKVFGHRYGTAAQCVAEMRAAGRDVILEIDWQGAAQVRGKAPEAIGIFVLPPSKAALQQRLELRAEDSPESIAERLEEARREVAHLQDYDYLVINEDFAAALTDLQTIVAAEQAQAGLSDRRGRLPLPAPSEEMFAQAQRLRAAVRISQERRLIEDLLS